MEAASAYPFLDYLRAEHHVKTPQAQLVQSLSLPASELYSLSCKVFCYCHNIEVAMTATGYVAGCEEKQPQKKNRLRGPPRGQQLGAAGMPNFYPYPANNAALATELDPNPTRETTICAPAPRAPVA
jgi:hypothetical protein